MAAAVLVDTHNHLHRGPSPTTDPSATPSTHDLLLHCPMAVQEDEEEWAVLPALLQHKDTPTVGLGIHPWWAHLARPGWGARLRTALEQLPHAIIGEIGLDKIATTKETGKTEWAAQVQVWEEQMRLASELRRPVSMHCVRAQGTVYDWLKARQAFEYPPSLAFHSYTGSPEMATALLRLPHLENRLFFGFSAAVCLRTPAAEAKLRDVLRVIPPTTILLESDLDDRAAIPDAMARICAFVAEATNLERQALVEITTGNAARFLLRRSLV